MWFFGKKKKEATEEAKQVEASPVKTEKECCKKAETKKCECTKGAEAQTAKKAECGCTKENDCGCEKDAKTTKCAKPAAKKTATKAAAKPAVKKEEVAQESTYRVAYDKASDTWKVTRDGAKRNLASAATKSEALARLKEMTAGKKVTVVVYNKDGKEQK